MSIYMDHRHTEYRVLQSKQHRTHPIVLIAAAGLTVFSILGSAAITGLLPVTSEKNTVGGILSEQSVILPLPTPNMSNSSFRQYLGIHEDSVGRPSTSAAGKAVQDAAGVKPSKSNSSSVLQGSKIKATGNEAKELAVNESLTA